MFITPLIVFPVYLYFNRMNVHETHEHGQTLTYDNKCIGNTKGSNICKKQREYGLNEK